VRQATAKYQDVNVALADGFVRTPTCVADPKLGGMGIHYVNPARIMDPAVNTLEPEMLIYSKAAEGLKLLGSEYMFAIGAPDTHVPNPAPPSPVIFGRPLDGPMGPDEPGQPAIMICTFGSGRQTRLAYLPCSIRMCIARNKRYVTAWVLAVGGIPIVNTQQVEPVVERRKPWTETTTTRSAQASTNARFRRSWRLVICCVRRDRLWRQQIRQTECWCELYLQGEN